MKGQPFQRGLKARRLNLKLVLQIILLVGAGVWVILQLKHSIGVRQEPHHGGGTVSGRVNEGQEDVIRLGRKGLDGDGVGEQEEPKNAVDGAGEKIFIDAVEDEDILADDESMDAVEDEEQNVEDEEQVTYDQNPGGDRSEDHDDGSGEGAETTGSGIDLPKLPSDHREKEDVVEAAAE